MTHYFVRDPSILDFLRKSLRDMDVDACRLFLRPGKHTFVGVLNFPTSSRLASVLFVAGDEALAPGAGGCVGHGFDNPVVHKLGGYFAVTRGFGDTTMPQTFWRLDTKEFAEDQEIAADQRLMAGLALYIKCFPECVTDGVPDDLKHAGHYHGRCVMLRPVPQILRPHDGPSPHYREGYFRTYRDERYVNVRGKTVWIDETFVLGKARTIDPPEKGAA